MTKVTKYDNPRTGEIRIEISLGDRTHSMSVVEARDLAKRILKKAGNEERGELIVWPCEARWQDGD